MKLSEDKLRDYFMDRCSRDDADAIQQALADGDSGTIDRVLNGILDELENSADEDTRGAREAYERFCRAVERQRIGRIRRMLGHVGSFMLRVAAVMSLPLAAGLAWILYNRPVPVEWVDYSVPLGECRMVELPDGSVLNLNSGSRVIYPSRFTGDDRRVFFTGEVFADVAKDPERPFVISVGDVNVQVFGTRFNFRAYDNLDNIEVALVEGSVMFRTSEADSAMMRPGELIQYNRDTHAMTRDTFNPDGYLCPAMGTGFTFNDLPLRDIVAQLEYCFNVRIVVDSPELLAHTYTAYLSNGESIDEILSKINESGNDLMDIRRDGRVIYLTAVDKHKN